MNFNVAQLKDDPNSMETLIVQGIGLEFES